MPRNKLTTEKWIDRRGKYDNNDLSFTCQQFGMETNILLVNFHERIHSLPLKSLRLLVCKREEENKTKTKREHTTLTIEYKRRDRRSLTC